METVHTPQVLILACGALATEIRDITRLHRLGNVTLECLPGILHNRPSEIPDAVRARLDRARGNYDRILLGYGDCGTAGELADIAAQEGIGFLIWNSRTFFRTDFVFVGIFCFGVLGFVADRLWRLLGRTLLSRYLTDLGAGTAPRSF